jgi:hypothetical protein
LNKARRKLTEKWKENAAKAKQDRIIKEKVEKEKKAEERSKQKEKEEKEKAEKENKLGRVRNRGPPV